MFRCALTEMETIEISIATDGSSYVSQLPIGYDENTTHRFSLMVAMESVPGYGPKTKELIFCVVEYDPSEDHFYQLWDGLETKAKIPDADHRQAILGALMQMVAALIDDVAPRVVTMHTRDAHLPPKALIKYQRISGIFDQMGYRAGRSDVWHGRHTWMMERTT